MPKTHQTTPLGKLLPALLENLQSNRLSQETIQEGWRRLVGEKAAHASWPRRLIRKRLVVEVENSGWMYTLSLKKQQILEGLIELFGANRVKQVTFRIGEGKNA